MAVEREYMAAPRDHSQPGKPPVLVIVVNVAWFFLMHRLSLAQAARERGYDVHIVCGVGEGQEAVRREGFTFHAIALRRNALSPMSDLLGTLQLYRLYRRLRPALVHHVTLKPILYGSLAARAAAVPAVVNAFAGLGYTFASFGLGAALRRGILVRALAVSMAHKNSRVLFENSDDQELFRRLGCVSPEQSRVIPGVGVDLEEFTVRPLPAKRVRVMLAGRMLREKGVEYFVAAARLLRQRNIAVDLVLTGKPDPENPGSVTREQLQAWADEGVVRWEGFRNDMGEAIAASHIICLPTYYREGVPRILLEAAAAGRAVVATDMPGCRDIVRPGQNGCLVPTHDAEALARAVQSLVEDPEGCRIMGLRGRSLVEAEFSLDIVLRRTFDLYRELLGPCAR